MAVVEGGDGGPGSRGLTGVDPSRGAPRGLRTSPPPPVLWSEAAREHRVGRARRGQRAGKGEGRLARLLNRDGWHQA